MEREKRKEKSESVLSGIAVPDYSQHFAKTFLLTHKSSRPILASSQSEFLSMDDAEPIDPEKVKSFGFLIADKQKGPFRLEIDWIKAYT